MRFTLLAALLLLFFNNVFALQSGDRIYVDSTGTCFTLSNQYTAYSDINNFLSDALVGQQATKVACGCPGPFGYPCIDPCQVYEGTFFGFIEFNSSYYIVTRIEPASGHWGFLAYYYNLTPVGCDGTEIFVRDTFPGEVLDSDNDTIPDDEDPFPDDPRCPSDARWNLYLKDIDIDCDQDNQSDCQANIYQDLTQTCPDLVLSNCPDSCNGNPVSDGVIVVSLGDGVTYDELIESDELDLDSNINGNDVEPPSFGIGDIKGDDIIDDSDGIVNNIKDNDLRILGELEGNIIEVLSEIEKATKSNVLEQMRTNEMLRDIENELEADFDSSSITPGSSEQFSSDIALEENQSSLKDLIIGRLSSLSPGNLVMPSVSASGDVCELSANLGRFGTFHASFCPYAGFLDRLGVVVLVLAAGWAAFILIGRG